MQLFPLKILYAVKRNRRNNYKSFEYKLKVRVNSKERKAVSKACEYSNTKNCAADFTYSAVK